jgi:hypothetical protein
MGSLSNMRAHGRGPRGGQYKGRAPLRRVVESHADNRLETLECGHTIHPPQDIIGPTNATRRRCHKCERAGIFGPKWQKDVDSASTG